MKRMLIIYTAIAVGLPALWIGARVWVLRRSEAALDCHFATAELIQFSKKRPTAGLAH